MNTSNSGTAESAREQLRREIGDQVDDLAAANDNLCVMFLEIDDAQRIREIYGDAVADQVGERVAGRISGCTRGNDLMWSIGGFEYVVVLSTISSQDDANFIADKVCCAIGELMGVSGHELHVSAHAGIAHGGFHRTGADLIASARAQCQEHQTR